MTTIEVDGIKKQIDIPITFAMSKENSTVQSHEMGHATVFKEFMANNPDAIGLVSDLEAYVKKNYGKEWGSFFAEIEEAYEGRSPREISEEKLAKLSEFMRKKNIKVLQNG